MALEPGGKAATLIVRESRVVQSSISITELTDQYLSTGMRQGFLAEDLQQVLKPVIDKHVEMAGVDRRIEELKSQQHAITTDQERLRENMKALRGSSEEKQLLQRYTRQLDEQEDRLETLRRELAQASATRARLDAELSALIQKTSFEGEGKS